jgi:hypothetical protein
VYVPFLFTFAFFWMVRHGWLCAHVPFSQIFLFCFTKPKPAKPVGLALALGARANRASELALDRGACLGSGERRRYLFFRFFSSIGSGNPFVPIGSVFFFL